MTVRGCPLRRPVVVSSSAGMPETVHPFRPPVTFRIARWTTFMVLKVRSAGTGRT